MKLPYEFFKPNSKGSKGCIMKGKSSFYLCLQSSFPEATTTTSFNLEQHWPKQFFVMMEIFFICAVQYSSL